MKIINNRRYKIKIFFILLITICIFSFKSKLLPTDLKSVQLVSLATFFYKNEKDIIIKESGKIDDSENNIFWLNSGGLFFVKDNHGQTIQGNLSKYSPWRLLYKISNPLDTDDGYHPQNVFRLITKKTEKDVSQSFYVLIRNDNVSKSPNRNESNGIFSMFRYQNSKTLYYAGIRVDGTAVIKKKRNGVYYTLSQINIFEGNPYNRETNPSLLPKKEWIGLKTVVKNRDNRTVEIELFLDKNNTNKWVKVLDVVDSGTNGSPPIFEEGNNGIRSDFMDIEIMNYSIESIN